MSLALWPRFIVGFIGELLLALGRWLIERPVRLVILALLLSSVWLWIGRDRARDLAADRRDQAAAWHAKFDAQKAEMLKLVGQVRAARIEAARLDQANIARVQAEWDEDQSEVIHDYQADLAAARDDLAIWMRRGTGPGATSVAGSGGKPVLPGLPAVPGGTVRAGPTATLDEAEADAVTDNTLRLEHLIDAWSRAAAIDTSRAPNDAR
ncbi:hypothetical protein OVY48_09960 [Sphingobium sp. SA2]|uniref:hypothetical protein n=1 Tax=Sphingobium sp. SA2 TaxID=1524832 RepID=UPI0028C1B34C|nr:hypothetical protein [Sphingobium sp. SA2]MDT7533748.1 hypothetical protein [Sphingobium sp. SA2]